MKAPKEHRFYGLLKSEDATGMYALRLNLPLSEYIELYNSFPRGSKMDSKGRVDNLVVEGRVILEDWLTAIQDDSSTIPDMLAELSEEEVEIVLSWATAEVEQIVREMI